MGQEEDETLADTPGPDTAPERRRERKVFDYIVDYEFVLWDRWGLGLFTAVFDEPAGPP